MTAGPGLARIATTRRAATALLASLVAALHLTSLAAEAGPERPRLVVVLYPEANDGRPGQRLADHGIRSTFAAGSTQGIEIHNEYLDLSRFPGAQYQQELAAFLQRKYARRKIDLVVAGLATALDFILEHRARVFPGVPIVCCAVDRREFAVRKMPADVCGVPINFDPAASLQLALQLQPKTERVFVVVGASQFDIYWETETRRAFRPYECRLKFDYLSGLSLQDLLKRVSNLPPHSIIYYVHVFQDGAGSAFSAADVLRQLADRANAPIFGHVDSFVGQGLVGGHVVSLEKEGKNAAALGLQILTGTRPEDIPPPAVSENSDMFDWRQVRRWGIDEKSLPPASVVLFKETSFWDLYKWQITGVGALCALQALLIVGLLMQRANRRRAEVGMQQSQRQLRRLSGKLLVAQEGERKRIAREIHDDYNQTLALLCVELELLGHDLPESQMQLRSRMAELSGRVKQLASSLHRLSHDLHPLKLEQLGLVAAVSGLCQEQSRHRGLDIEFICEHAPEGISKDAALSLYRVAQEALHNVVKHSRAGHARVELLNGDAVICLRIVDDGIGFDSNSGTKATGLGLVSMRERLRLVGGDISIVSSPSGGTQIEARVPLDSNGVLDSQLPSDSERLT